MIERRLFLLSVAAVAAGFGGTAVGESTNAFTMTSITLYLPNEALRERGPSVEALAGYVKALVAKANGILTAAPRGRGATGALVVGLKPPARSRLWVMVGDSSRKSEFVRALKAPLEAVPPPSVRGFNAFAINFNAWGGGTPLAEPLPPVPQEWRRVITHEGVLPDVAFEAVWPD